MKKVVWKNKSNGQLCVTIPSTSNLQEGDIVELKKSEVKKIVYHGIVADLFHYGHLQSILFGRSLADLTICGVLSDEAVEKYRVRPLSSLKERKAVLMNLSCVDRVMVQKSRDPTENLEQIHKEFPNAEIILVHGSDWADVPGAEFLQQIGGQVVKHPYYANLSTFKIITYFLENKDKFKDIVDFSQYINKDSASLSLNDKVIVSSKADTLKALQPSLTKSKIEPMYVFSISDWKNKKVEIISAIQQKFAGGKIVVRSSAVNEDTLDKSMAGCFESVLSVDPNQEAQVEEAIKTVLRSYQQKDAESSFNQVLVQKHTENIVLSGVIFTRTLEKNAPYYVINYDESGSSNSVTSGKESKTMTLFHFASQTPEKMRSLLTAVKEIEQKIPKIPLDIEFAVNDKKEVVIFQVRPLAANIHKETNDEQVRLKIKELQDKFHQLGQSQEHLAGDYSILADMPDWNPAEIIGDHPHHLDYSLYDYLITNSAWHEARTSQGYYNVSPAKLVELIGNKPYVNVRNTFNSFTPASISHRLRKKLIHFYLEKLKQNPHLQDKVEFEILHTCYDLNFEKRSQELIAAGFTEEEIQELKIPLIKLTNNLVLDSPKTIAEDLQQVFDLEELRKKIRIDLERQNSVPGKISLAKSLLDDCRKQGTVQFSRLARLAFVGKTLLKSLANKQIIGPEFYDNLLGSIQTVATTMSRDFQQLNQGKLTKEEFIEKYFHLRPGTYDITSPNYRSHPDLLQAINISLTQAEEKNFHLDPETASKITQALEQSGLQFDAAALIGFVKSALEARELSKFEFTKNLSEALEILAKVGEENGFTRRELASLGVDDFFRFKLSEEVNQIIDHWKTVIKAREKERDLQEQLVLPPIIFSPLDLEIIEPYASKPNFVTQKKLRRKVVVYHNGLTEIPEMEDNIVVLENGDPGYDWIFTRNPAGLITKYGGVASHMAIRCAEFGLPAAIGCGENIFNHVKNSSEVILDCQANKIIPLRGG